MVRSSPAACVVSGPSGSGKTTLVERLVAELVRRGVKTATAKHRRSPVETDVAGKDTWRHRRAGAAATFFVASGQVTAWIDAPGETRPEALAPLCPEGTRLLLAEGYKELHGIPRIVVEGEGGDAQLDADTLCVVTPRVRPLGNVPVFHRDDIAALADFLVARFLENKA
jgi:molybdopterin-guanine dinucleotide biosynthesis protein B